MKLLSLSGITVLILFAFSTGVMVRYSVVDRKIKAKRNQVVRKSLDGSSEKETNVLSRQQRVALSATQSGSMKPIASTRFQPDANVIQQPAMDSVRMASSTERESLPFSRPNNDPIQASFPQEHQPQRYVPYVESRKLKSRFKRALLDRNNPISRIESKLASIIAANHGAEFVGGDLVPNALGRAVECERWQSDLESRTVFDNIAEDGKPSMAQYKQDIIMFKTILTPASVPQERGFYIELGANLPRALSNTYFFDICRGWSGLCIEPNPLVRSRLEDRDKWGRTCTISDRCISNTDGQDVQFVLAGGLGGIDGLRYTNQDEEWIGRMVRARHTHLLTSDFKMRKVAMTCTTLEKEIEKTDLSEFPSGIDSKGRKIVDLLSLDVEGAELQVIQGCNEFKKLHVRYILLEAPLLFKPQSVISLDFIDQPFYGVFQELQRLGYIMLMRMSSNVVWYHETEAPKVDLGRVDAVCGAYSQDECLVCSSASNQNMCV